MKITNIRLIHIEVQVVQVTFDNGNQQIYKLAEAEPVFKTFKNLSTKLCCIHNKS